MRDPYASGIIGNGETAALIADDASVSWLCVPRFDGPLLFAAGLDPERGGSWRLLVDGAPPEPVSQEYAGDTNLLLTRGRAGGIEVEVLDWMPWDRPLLIRDVRLRNPGPATVRCAVAAEAVPPRSRWLPWQAGVEGRLETLAFDVKSPVVDRVCFLPAGWRGLHVAWGPRGQVSLELPPGAEARQRWVLAYAPSRSAAVRLARAGTAADPVETAAFWERWLAGARPLPVADPWLDRLYRRSLLTLKLLQHRDGAFVAAATASWPATPGGRDNWDYRFCWFRDGAFTAEALDLAGFHDEARRFYRFALGLQRPDGEWPYPLLTMDGRVPGEIEVDDLAGPGGERPVRLGNGAAIQLQLDTPGHVLDGLLLHVQLTGDLAFLRECWPAVRRAADWVAGNWHRVEHGLWEIREYQGHWLHGKVLCWAALDRASRMARLLDEPEAAGRYAEAARTVRAYVLEHGWSEARGAFVQRCDAPPVIDVSALAVGEYGLLPPSDPRVEATAAAVERPGPHGLRREGGVARWEGHELPFVLATFWLARHHARAGRGERARELLGEALRCATALGLMAEQYDPARRRPSGNFPQAFSHEEFVRAVWEAAGIPVGRQHQAAGG